AMSHFGIACASPRARRISTFQHQRDGHLSCPHRIQYLDSVLHGCCEKRSPGKRDAAGASNFAARGRGAGSLARPNLSGERGRKAKLTFSYLVTAFAGSYLTLRFSADSLPRLLTISY